jgi:hypothetical protein
MRRLCGVVFGLTLAALAFEAPAPASPASSPMAPLGMVMSAADARSGVDVVTSGATIYDGDQLATRDEGAMMLRIGAGRLFLHKATSVQVHALSNGFSANLDQGTVSMSSEEGRTFELLTDGLTIRPVGLHSSSAQIERVSATEVVLISTRGDLQVSLGDEVETVRAGNSYKVEIDPLAAEAASAAGEPQGPVFTGRRRKGFYIVLISAIAAVTAVLIWRAVLSPTQP